MKKINTGSPFSDLETDILNYLWSKGEGRSRTIYLLFGGKHGVTHSTVAVTLNRLHEKGILKRKSETARGGVRFVYHPTMTKEELGTDIGYNFLEFLRNTFGESSIANLKKKLK